MFGNEQFGKRQIDFFCRYRERVNGVIKYSEEEWR